MPPKYNFVGSPRHRRNTTYISDTRIPPEPWVVLFSKTVDPGRQYYLNERTGQSQWEFPEDDYIELSHAHRPPQQPPSQPLLLRAEPLLCKIGEIRDPLTGMCRIAEPKARLTYDKLGDVLLRGLTDDKIREVLLRGVNRLPEPKAGMSTLNVFERDTLARNLMRRISRNGMFTNLDVRDAIRNTRNADELTELNRILANMENRNRENRDENGDIIMEEPLDSESDSESDNKLDRWADSFYL